MSKFILNIKPSTTLHTKFGTARINKYGHFQIDTVKENNKNKYLHRLIYENYHNVKLDTDCIVHHKDENKTNNCIFNLETMSRKKHSKLHYKEEYNKHISKEAKQKMRMAKLGTKQSKETIKKISESHMGTKNPSSKYELWENHKVGYNIYDMFKNNKQPNPCKCFYLRRKGRRVKGMGFIDPLSPTIIYDLIEDFS